MALIENIQNRINSTGLFYVLMGLPVVGSTMRDNILVNELINSSSNQLKDTITF